MKTLKRLLVLLLTICMILPVVACGGGEENCTHDNSVICKKCGVIVLGDDYYSNMVKSTNSVISKGKGIKMEASGTVNVVLDEETGTFHYEDVNGDYQKLIAPNVDGEISMDITYGFKKDGKLYADGDMACNFEMKDNQGKALIKADINSESLKFENNKLNYKIVSIVKLPTLSDAEKQLNEENVVIEDSIDLSENPEVGAILDQMVPTVLEAYTDTIVPYVNGIIDVNKKDIGLAVAGVLDTLCTVSKDGTNNVFTMTKLGGHLKKLPTMLDTKVSVVVDDILGAGTYDKLPETVEKLLDTKLEDVLKTLEAKGIKIDELVGVADEVIKKVAGEEASLEALIGFDLVGAIDNLDKTKTIKQIIVNYGVTEQQIEEFIEQLGTILKEYKDKSVYEILNNVIGTEITKEQKDLIKEVVDAVADFIDETITVKLTADKNGNVLSYEYGIKLDGSSEAFNGVLDVVDKFVNFPYVGEGQTSPEEVQYNAIVNILSSVKCKITYKTSFVSLA